MEAQDLEHKSSFAGSDKEWLELVKTIVAMANTAGGHMTLGDVTFDDGSLDSARLDDRVNKYVRPRVSSIGSGREADGTWEITVDRTHELHVFIQEASYVDKNGRLKSAFHPGQIYVRHSSKTEPANADDITGFIRDAIANWLHKLGQGIESLAVDVSSEESGMPIHLSADAGALSISADPNDLWPYTARTLGEAVGKDQNWAARAIDALGLKDSRKYCWGARGASGEVNIWKYSQAAVDSVKEMIAQDPSWNPYLQAHRGGQGAG
jgi:hypothetical protein